MKLTSEQKEEICRAYNKPKEKFLRKITIRSLAQRYNVCDNTIRKILCDTKD